MELQEILDGTLDFKTLVTSIQKTKGKFDYTAMKKQYDPLQHDVVTNQVTRPDKQVKTDTGTKNVFVARLPIPFQKMIVNYAATFLVGNPVELMASVEENTPEDNLMQTIFKTWDDNKLDYESKKLAKLLMSETEVAELWYFEDAAEGYWKGTPNDKPSVKKKLRMKVLANKYGDLLYPIFNMYGDMIAFVRAYTVTRNTEKIDHFDVYTDEKTYLAAKENNEWIVLSEDNPSKKIPIIYYSQEHPEWYDVQSLIERYEMSISKHADNNDYYGHPLMAVHGKIKSFADKGDDGKVIELEPNAKIEMITWPQAPESVKLEQQTLLNNIFLNSFTPKLTEEDVKGLGNYSGIALKMLFMPAHMKAADKEETFGKGIQRRLNFLKAALAWVNTDYEGVQLSVKPKFKYYLPKNEIEEVNMLTMAMSGEKPLISQETAIDLCTLIEDKVAEKERLKDEQESESTSPAGLNRLMNAV